MSFFVRFCGSLGRIGMIERSLKGRVYLTVSSCFNHTIIRRPIFSCFMLNPRHYSHNFLALHVRCDDLNYQLRNFIIHHFWG